ncbi:MAG TPA: class I SAM-dependent methyltransferase [Gaiellaceae bacterium]|nr:class I SAM-dependent methyltransferase [Gaiellaceae bacterium]
MAERARSFDRVAEEYERARAEYPPAVLDGLPLRDDAEVLDVGAGTGKLTRLLTERYRRVIAVEPLDGMRAVLERVVPAAESHAGSAEAIPLSDASVDAVFAGQAFHWFANDVAVSEMARVLRPGGVLALVWNEPDDDRPSPLPEEYQAYIRGLHDVSMADFEGAPPWQDVIARGPFGEVHEANVPHDHVLDRAGVLDNARSVSWIASLPDEEREATMRRLDELLGDGPYAIPNRANIMWAVRGASGAHV